MRQTLAKYLKNKSINNNGEVSQALYRKAKKEYYRLRREKGK